MKRNPIERSLDIEQAQLRGFARSLSEIEWLLLILVILYLFVTRPDLAQEAPVIGSLIGFALFVLAFRYGRLLSGRARIKIVFEILAMLAFLTAILSFAGGEHSPLINLYLLPVVAAALTLGKSATTFVLVLVAACYLLLATLSGPPSAVLGTALAADAVSVLAPFVLVAFSTTLLAENIHRAKERIKALSDRDELTGVYNLRAFNRLAAREHDRASRSSGRYAVLMVDVDRLKAINDTYGHEAGNRAVALVGDALQRLTRSTDTVARFGGDEFVVLLADAGRQVADEVAQRIRNVVFSTTLEIDVKMVRIKASVGVGTFPEDGNALQPVMAAADRAMYKDKEEREPPKGRLVIRKR
ncbi:MAG TPA: GGDEF domain-containing protein [Gammaproteobacteria bacterium]|nr:GGDEF domain-containing protein [Gammaproteobacteria bacterium]